MSKYLYGASVQGIQGYIFETNRLKEIIGASKIVESLNQTNFKDDYNLQKEPKVILKIAGTIILSFENEEDARKVFKNFTKDIKEKAYGIVISQAIVEYSDYQEGRGKLEEILKIQRNITDIPLDYHFSILKQNPRTAKPLFRLKTENNKEIAYDKSSFQKLEAFENFNKKQINQNLSQNAPKPIFEIEELSNNKNKIAIIHADGNGLGNLVKDMNEDELISFSKKLDNATNSATNNAIDKINQKYFLHVMDEKVMKFKHRKIILDGDDLTIICDASYALEFTYIFLDEFEKLTKDLYKGNNLTSCAGIAYCNEKFPLFYAVNLAESLCSFSKKDSKKINKDLPPSSLMFHNIQSSYVKNFDNFLKDELTLGNNIKCDFGPYYLNESSKPQIQNLIATIEDFSDDKSPSSRLREWLSELDVNEIYADKKLQRINQMCKESNWKSENLLKFHADLSFAKDEKANLIVKKDDCLKTPIYDILQILSLQGKDNEI